MLFPAAFIGLFVFLYGVTTLDHCQVRYGKLMGELVLAVCTLRWRSFSLLSRSPVGKWKASLGPLCPLSSQLWSFATMETEVTTPDRCMSSHTSMDNSLPSSSYKLFPSWVFPYLKSGTCWCRMKARNPIFINSLFLQGISLFLNNEDPSSNWWCPLSDQFLDSNQSLSFLSRIWLQIFIDILLHN